MELQGGFQGSTEEELNLGEREGALDRLAGLLGRLGVPQGVVAGVARDALSKAEVFTEVLEIDRPSFPWLLSIGFQAAAEYWRRGNRASHLAGWGEMLPDESAEATAIELLKMGFEWLPPIRRQVVELRDLLGLSVPRISDTLGISVAAARSHLRLGRRDLAAAIRSALSAAAVPLD